MTAVRTVLVPLSLTTGTWSEPSGISFKRCTWRSDVETYPETTRRLRTICWRWRPSLSRCPLGCCSEMCWRTWREGWTATSLCHNDKHTGAYQYIGLELKRKIKFLHISTNKSVLLVSVKYCWMRCSKTCRCCWEFTWEWWEWERWVTARNWTAAQTETTQPHSFSLGTYKLCTDPDRTRWMGNNCLFFYNFFLKLEILAADCLLSEEGDPEGLVHCYEVFRQLSICTMAFYPNIFFNIWVTKNITFGKRFSRL